MNTSSHEGHRQRLREKFLKNGLEGFLDYEIIELLLTLGTPRSDCKQPAKSALKQFGSLKAVLEADIKDLKAIKGIGDKNVFGLKLSQAVSRKYLSDRILNQDFVRSSDDVLTYLKHNLRDKNHEVFMVIYLNGRNQILKMEELFKGTLNTSAVYPREVIKRALENDAAALVFVHNHPSGNPNPSKDDLTITKKLKEATASIDISIHDHLIIAGNDVYSFADHGLI
ncbi:MAG: DNA repair protein RadC [Candidatus Marinimicrobia bacterium]|jgi:DNA repair protein RadC|nr:DNA repair protein RadC [Candidatus Neomarinimicrobiota bacterium]MBT3496852.1 DNA repair protein RadC [Candidatus Neomarinimicrobiota bacterium]MBT3692154.1 DNA repair protein RadC [Candidatus Neomarinimicrobiota bacterium]MBT3732622.1 DNA repair protein RadC [Candidatus Neomarinimicrobiota bacterium]MBT4145261.1 DNA repair protein RadC [Candidatus Neomarinimicrobiota bacterium]